MRFAPLFKMLEASFELFVPLVVAAIIDTGIAHADKGLCYPYVPASVFACPHRTDLRGNGAVFQC